MSKKISDIRAAIDAIVPVEGEFEGWTQADLGALAALVDTYFLHPEAADHLDVWFDLYERFPESDAYGIFWSILHGIERFDPSGERVVASVVRKPARFPVLMVNGMINSGVESVGGVNLIHLLERVALSPSAAAGVRADAADFLEHQRAKS